jgi:hypothetical protein
MIIKSKIAAATLIAGLSLGATAQASEVSHEDMVGVIMAKVISSTQQELRNNLDQAILSASHAFNIIDKNPYVATVMITDLESEELTMREAE